MQKIWEMNQKIANHKNITQYIKSVFHSTLQYDVRSYKKGELSPGSYVSLDFYCWHLNNDLFFLNKNRDSKKKLNTKTRFDFFPHSSLSFSRYPSPITLTTKAHDMRDEYYLAEKFCSHANSCVLHEKRSYG